ncbi:hypothetical protein SAMN04487786_0749 [Paenisporosarcina quisquiliarum]|nr:hypothetical protein SAMN04487786_0749 [Paenisporosarcina quisquiliarum]
MFIDYLRVYSFSEYLLYNKRKGVDYFERHIIYTL